MSGAQLEQRPQHAPDEISCPAIIPEKVEKLDEKWVVIGVYTATAFSNVLALDRWESDDWGSLDAIEYGIPIRETKCFVCYVCVRV